MEANNTRLAAIVGACLFGWLASAQAAFDQYTITDLGALSGDYSMPYDINEHGDVVGITRSATDTREHGFYWTAGQPMVDLGPGHAMGLNDQNLIVGTLASGNLGMWKTTDVTFPLPFRDLGIKSADSLTGLGERFGAKINQQGAVVATRSGAKPILWDRGQITNLGLGSACEGGRFTIGINNRGEALFYSSGAKILRRGLVEALPSQGAQYAVGINDLSEFITEDMDFGSEVYSPNFGFRGLSGLSTARDINNEGYVVGGGGYGEISRYSPAVGGDAWIYSLQDDQSADLNTLIPANSGWLLGIAMAINNAGQIAGVGTNPQGKTHAFLLTPVKSY